MSKLNKKDLSIEVMRIVAAYFVIFNHGGGFTLFQSYETGSIQFWTYLFMSIFCKFAVPLFFMISGALLLGKEEPIKVVLKKRVGKMVVVLVAISLVYYVGGLVFGRIPFEGLRNIWDFLGKLSSGQGSGHLWYMYSYIVLLLLLPFFRVMIKGMTKNMITYFCILAIAFNCVIPVVQYLMFQGEHELYASFHIFTMKNIAAPFIGYWLLVRLDYSRVKRKHIILLWVANIASICLACLMTYITIKNIGTNSGYEAERFFYNFATLNAATILITIKKYYKPFTSERINKIISTVAGATFGIYLFHFLSFNFGWFNYVARALATVHMPMLGWLITAGIYFIFNLVGVLILQKIPIVKNYI